MFNGKLDNILFSIIVAMVMIFCRQVRDTVHQWAKSVQPTVSMDTESLNASHVFGQTVAKILVTKPTGQSCRKYLML